MHPRRPALRQRADDDVVVAHAQAVKGIGALLLEPAGHGEALPPPARQHKCRPLRAVVRLVRRRRALHGRLFAEPMFADLSERRYAPSLRHVATGRQRIYVADSLGRSMRMADYGRSCVRCEISRVTREHSITQNTSPHRRHIRWHRCIKTCALISRQLRCCQVSGKGYAGTSGHGA